MEDITSFWLPVVLVPIIIAHAVAFALGRVLSVRFDRIPDPLKVTVAGLSPTLAVIGYFWIWQKIDLALLQEPPVAEYYMGPMVFLIYGWPILLAVAIASFFFAAHVFYGRKKFPRK
ncbi:hypothetical protein [Erythrobacter ani]|uniref:Uncharacterized protein n=1 Tax=Erythrobacter ani TaxID=2827235 RepID=A0ABS6SP82_9SPHN|nr:hypothetical protein [Erythrobacter ani]MBV7266839.1 hypothetical protein [Erythrobacter ani]